MKDAKMADRPQMHWVPAIDERGHAYLKAVWMTPTPQVRPSTPHAA